MDIVLRQLTDGDVPVLSVAGEVDLATVPRLRDAFVRLAADHPGTTAVVDLDGVTLLDSVGLGALVGGLRRMRTSGGDLALVCTTPRLTELLALCRLDRVFEIHSSVAAAAGAIPVADEDALESGDDEEPELTKPDELVALHTVTTELFEILRRWFAVPDEVSLDLTEIDSAVREMGDPVMIAALAMRKLQALHLIATPGVRTTTDVVVTIVQDLDRALLQAPVMRLRLAAETTDWDAALAELEAGGSSEAPSSADAEDPEAQRFRMLHTLLHAAVEAVLRASDGEIRIFV